MAPQLESRQDSTVVDDAERRLLEQALGKLVFPGPAVPAEPDECPLRLRTLAAALRLARKRCGAEAAQLPAVRLGLQPGVQLATVAAKPGETAQLPVAFTPHGGSWPTEGTSWGPVPPHAQAALTTAAEACALAGCLR